MPYRPGDVRLADAGLADHHDALVALHEGARGEVDDLGLRDRRVETGVDAGARVAGQVGEHSIGRRASTTERALLTNGKVVPRPQPIERRRPAGP
jgi:hypothetical protein